MSTDYRVLPHATPTPSRIALARRYITVEDACRAMGRGVVFAVEDGKPRIAAFHESHLAVIERMGLTHEHAAHATTNHPPYNPSRFEEWCACGHYRYRVTGGPWTPWEPAEVDPPQWAEVTDPRALRARRKGSE